MSAASAIPITEAIIAKGQRAWTEEKASAAESRTRWLEIGNALQVGRSLHRADRAFAEWVREKGFDDMPRGVRADAMWLSQQGLEVYTALTPDTAHPTHIRQWHREQATRPLSTQSSSRPLRPPLRPS